MEDLNKLNDLEQGKQSVAPHEIDLQSIEPVTLLVNGLTDDERKRLLKILFEDSADKMDRNGELYYNLEAIIKDLKENYVQIDENKEYLGLKGKIVHINLPAVGNFKGFKLDAFVSNENISDKKSGLYRKGQDYPFVKKNKISELFKAMSSYLKEYGIFTDGDNFDYNINGIKSRVGCYVEKIIGFNGTYWLGDQEDRSLYTDSFGEGDYIQLVCDNTGWYYKPIHYGPYSYDSYKCYPAGCILELPE